MSGLKLSKEQQNVGWMGELLAWYDVNKRDLPWRESKDPYRIWVSEVMSQQTRIEAVKPYFENWMEQFPTMEALADAHEDTVVRAWQGLGYYSRARNLHAGVREVVSAYGGKVPMNRKAMESLKGVGSYTAGAVLSIAYNLREPAVDGNVLRVYARLYDIHEDILSTKGKKTITALVEETLPYDRPGDFNEALMDFGASICIPKYPKCDKCVLTKYCKAYEKGTTEDLPVRIKKTKVKTVPILVGILSIDGYYLLHKRGEEGLLHSMWEFPSVEGYPLLEGKEVLNTMMEELGFSLTLDSSEISEVTHIFSHRKWIMKGFKGTLLCNDDTICANVMHRKEKGRSIDANIETESPEFMELLQIGRMIRLQPQWILIRKEDFHALPWAGPHGKFIEFCD